VGPLPRATFSLARDFSSTEEVDTEVEKCFEDGSRDR
jgi:hypothetical protein